MRAVVSGSARLHCGTDGHAAPDVWAPGVPEGQCCHQVGNMLDMEDALPRWLVHIEYNNATYFVYLYALIQAHEEMVPPSNIVDHEEQNLAGANPSCDCAVCEDVEITHVTCLPGAAVDPDPHGKFFELVGHLMGNY